MIYKSKVDVDCELTKQGYKDDYYICGAVPISLWPVLDKENWNFYNRHSNNVGFTYKSQILIKIQQKVLNKNDAEWKMIC